jgi:hypothetical protein
MSAAAAPPAACAATAAAATPSATVPPSATAAVAQPPIDLYDSDSYSSADENSGSCEIVESVGNKGKTSSICLSGDDWQIMLEKVKANSSKGNPNVSSHEIAMMMLQSVVAKRMQLVELVGGLDGTMEIPNGGKTSICKFALESYSSKYSKEVNQDLHCHAHGGYLGHHIRYGEDRSPPQNGEARPPVIP